MLSALVQVLLRSLTPLLISRQINIRPNRMELSVRPGSKHNCQAVVCAAGDEEPALTQIELYSLRRDAAPVGIVPAREGRLSMVSRGLDGAGHEGVSAVRADHDAGSFCDSRTALRTAADASDARTFPDEFPHCKPLY